MREYGKVEVTIKGKSPLLMNRMNPEDLMGRKVKSKMKTNDYEAEAQRTAYIDTIKGKRQLYIPNEAVFRCLLNTSSMRKTNRMSLKGILAGSIQITPEKIGLGTDKYEVDLRPVVIQRAKVLKARAKIQNWEATFTIEYNKDFIEPILDVIKDVLEEAGVRMGLLDYRPQKGGSFGTFEVIDWKVIS